MECELNMKMNTTKTKTLVYSRGNNIRRREKLIMEIS